MKTKRRSLLALRWLLPVVVCQWLLLLTGCFGNPDYPRQLVEADSLIMRGNYRQADSLLACYRSQPHRDSRAELMYQKLLVAGLSYKQHQTVTDFALLDSLTDYYDGYDTPEKHAKAVFYTGLAYHHYCDYPLAMESYLQAEAEARSAGDIRLQSWIARQEGDLFFQQGMYANVEEPYRRYYHLAEANHDRRQMSIASLCMGKVYTLLNNIDSTIYFYQQSIHLGSGLPDERLIVPYARASLADVYIQIEEYDSAAMFMPRDTFQQNVYNWGDWHYAQQHFDSAVHYYRQALRREQRLGARVEVFRYLADIAESRGHHAAATQYLDTVLVLQDSMKVQNREKETLQAKAQHEYDTIKAERDQATRKEKTILYLSFVVLLIVILVSVICYLAWINYRDRQEKLLIHERLLKQEEQEKYSKSLEQIADNNRLIGQLKAQLAEAQRNNDSRAMKRIANETQLLKAQNQTIEAAQLYQQNLEDELRQSRLYQYIISNVGNDKFRLHDEEWQQLAEMLDHTYDRFTQRLLVLSRLSKLELHICYLVKLGVRPTNISNIINRSKSAVSIARRRMYKKLTQHDGSSESFDAFIRDF